MRIRVRLTPKGGRDAIEGWWTDSVGKQALKVRVAAPPEGGKANASLLDLLAAALGTGKSKLRIASGAASRLKVVEVEGDEALLAQRLRQAANG